MNNFQKESRVKCTTRTHATFPGAEVSGGLHLEKIWKGRRRLWWMISLTHLGLKATRDLGSQPGWPFVLRLVIYFINNKMLSATSKGTAADRGIWGIQEQRAGWSFSRKCSDFRPSCWANATVLLLQEKKP